MLVKLNNGVPAEWPVAEAHIQFTNPNTSFAFPLTQETLDAFGYGEFKHSDPATYDAEFQEPKELPPVLQDGKWVQQWEIVEKYTAAEKADLIAKRDAARAEAKANEYKFLRASAYPAIGDQLDALFHAGVFPADMAALIQAVKDKYPKGQ